MLSRLTDNEDISFTTFVPSVPLDIRESSTVTCSAEPLLHPTLFSLAKVKHNSIRIRLCNNDSAWSEAFRIDVNGVNGVCYVFSFLCVNVRFRPSPQLNMFTHSLYAFRELLGYLQGVSSFQFLLSLC